MTKLINKILQTENIYDADFFYCNAENVGNCDFRLHTEEQENDLQVYCVSFTYNNNYYEIAIDNNFVGNLINILN